MTNQTITAFGFPETLIKEYEHWTVLLREQQVTLGSLVLCAKSEVTEFSALTSVEFLELGKVIDDIERDLHKAFEYDKINYLMLMMVDPNVHFHVIPRYAAERNACGVKLSDSGWPSAPNLRDARELTSIEREHLCSFIIGLW